MHIRIHSRQGLDQGRISLRAAFRRQSSRYSYGPTATVHKEADMMQTEQEEIS